ncbi:gamma-glutamyltransferase family protein [Leucobacter soli]|uniref:Glutathione hydrolase-like YwrD proenzyme n=1 Tax=Leucobacter soli TaxID=2812850 RepID=A0A916NNI5_9MICO|nr:gamma-glutamyltransferase [Leucobacter soli]CAG7613168.1 Glutathione hydrolase-like YwrD proenzyme [Leucobacter soli]
MTDHTGPRGAISTSHHLATEAGADALRAGGNAIDAALAAAATLCVVYPNNVALGGDLVALVRSPEGEIRFLNATGAAPGEQSLDALRERHGAELPSRGIDTVTVPGGVCGWNSLHEYGAKLAWAEHFAAAIRHAEGHPTARSVAAALIEDRDSLAQDPGAAAVFYPNGEPRGEGETLAQPALAQTLRRLAAGGSAEFYTGLTADLWIAGLQKLGSKITKRDSDEFQAYWTEPLEGRFAGLRVLTGPPNTSGFMLLRALEAVSAGIDDPLGAGADDLAQAFHEANLVRAAELADPRFGGASGAELVAMPAPDGRVGGARTASGDTVGLSAVSSDGWAVSLINSVYWGFGAHILEPETGIIFQNRGTAFSLDPDSPNAFAPGKRPKHTLMPVLVLRGDEPVFVPATMGGSAQPQIHAQLLLRCLAGADPTEATHAPRWIVRESRGGAPATVMIEEDVPQQVVDALGAAGFPLEVVPRYTESLGHSNLIRVDPEGYAAASDPRSDGSAIVV